MFKLPVDLICVDGRTNIDALTLSKRALEYSCREIEFNSVQFLSPKKLDGNFQYHQIERISSMEEYSRFMIKRLKDYVSSPHCLLVQWDGFVVRPDLWRDEFLQYDYIGAPWPPFWPQCQINRIGNGGFSLRSRSLINIVSFLDFESSPSKIEDNFMCLENKDKLESIGIRFAPVSVAAQFSWENPIPENGPENTFGFHGRHEYVSDYLNLIK